MSHRFAASHTGQGIILLASLGLVVLAIAGPTLAALIRHGGRGRPVPPHLRRRPGPPFLPEHRIVVEASRHRRSFEPGRFARLARKFAGRRSIHRRRGSPSTWDTRGHRRTARR